MTWGRTAGDMGQGGVQVEHCYVTCAGSWQRAGEPRAGGPGAQWWQQRPRLPGPYQGRQRRTPQERKLEASYHIDPVPRDVVTGPVAEGPASAWLTQKERQALLFLLQNSSTGPQRPGRKQVACVRVR